MMSFNIYLFVRQICNFLFEFAKLRNVNVSVIDTVPIYTRHYHFCVLKNKTIKILLFRHKMCKIVETSDELYLTTTRILHVSTVRLWYAS